MARPSSAASEDSTSGCTERESTSSSSASRTPTDAESLPDIGRGSPASRMSGKSTWQAFDEFNQSMVEDGTHPTLRVASPWNLISSSEDFPAKICPSLAVEPGSKEASDPASSSSSHESLTLFSDQEAGSSLRTFSDFFPPTVAEISPSYSRRWPSSGFTTSPGECWTADTSECPSDGAASSSLPDVLEADVPSRFYLSPKAAAGILRRAEKRGRELPEALATALRLLAALHAESADGSTAKPKTLSRPSTAKAGEPTTTTPRPDTSSLTPSEPRDSTPARTAPGAVRRLSPTECERLQGFPDGWTWVPSRTTSPASGPQAEDRVEATSTEPPRTPTAAPSTPAQTDPAMPPAETP